jgi:hypothetical protein
MIKKLQPLTAWRWWYMRPVYTSLRRNGLVRRGSDRQLDAPREEPPGVQAEAIEMAVDHHFCGVLRMIDIAFRVRLVTSFPRG